MFSKQVANTMYKESKKEYLDILLELQYVYETIMIRRFYNRDLDNSEYKYKQIIEYVDYLESVRNRLKSRLVHIRQVI